MEKLTWNVYRFNINSQSMEVYDIFFGDYFEDKFKKLYKECDKNRDAFEELVKRELMYHFWCRAEYEIIIAPWCGCRNEKAAQKIDIYEQIKINWVPFIEYVWSHIAG